MSRKSPAFSFYPDSWVLGTMAMTFEEQGVYLRMLCFQWANGPSDANAYANACGLAYQTHVERILFGKFVRIGNAWCNERLEQERLKQVSRSEKAKTSAKQRWEQQSGADESCERNANAYANALPNDMLSVSVSVSDSKSNKKERTLSRFVPPSLEEVKAYAAEAKLTNIDADSFHDHYTANGWRQGGGKPIKDWKAACRLWNRRQHEFGKPKQEPQVSTYKRI